MQLRSRLFVIVALIGAMSVVAAPQSDPAKVAMEAARKKALIDGDLNTAIKQYKEIVSRYKNQKNQRPIVAEALLRMADSYRSMGDAEARKIYEQVVMEYGDQLATAAEAQAHLRTLAVAPASGSNSRGRTQLLLEGVWEALSPDGRYLLGTGTDGDTFDLVTGEQKVMWSGEDALFDYPVVSPDGKRVAWEGWGDEIGISEIRISPFAISAATSNKVLFHNKDYFDTAPFGWSLDGNEIFAVLERQDRKIDIAAISTANGSLRILKTLESRAPDKLSLSPDGKYIVYDAPIASNSANRDIFLTATDGSGETPVVKDPSRDTSPVWTPDGKAIVFISDRLGTAGLWKIQIEKGTPRGQAEPLRPNTGELRIIGFSRDGSFYYNTRPAGSVNDIFTAEIDLEAGTVSRPAAQALERFPGHNSAPSYSPDGKSMAYFSQRSTVGGFVSIVIRSLVSKEEHEIPTVFTGPSGLVWFPDGGSLLFTAFTEGPERASLHRIDAKTGADLMTVKIEGNFPSVAPDGKRIYFVRNGGQGSDPSLMAYDLESQRETVLFTGKIPAGQGQRRLALSGDGQQIAFTLTVESPSVTSLTAPNGSASVNTALYIVPTVGGSARRLRSPATQQVRAIQWSSDGKKVLAQRGNGELWWVPVEGGEAQRIGTVLFPAIESFHPDTKQIANTQSSRGPSSELWLDPDLVSSRPGIPSENGIYIASMDPGNGKVSGPVVRWTGVAGDCAPAWSPDGKTIVFKRRPNSSVQSQGAWVVRTLDTGSEKVFTVNSPNCWSAPIWFHDGKSLLNASFLEQGRAPFRLDLNTGQSTNLQLPTYKPAIALSQDDKTLYLTVVDQKDKSASIVSVDLAGGVQKRVWVSPIAADPNILVPLRLALSPDGRTLALVLSDSKASHLVRVGVDGNGYREILSAERVGADAALSRSGLAWTRDGRSILFVDSAKSDQRLMRVSAEGSSKPEFTGLVIANSDVMFDLSPDGRRIVFYSPRTPNIAASGAR